ncbi:hypothetical protein CCH79_00007806 [Gambusia affinis]|uniref:Uncharacterized protein n=1 Tax=Gambusia affinis TaxID=33528 RepID=A0A315W1J6_GAMAF|nr:hypothetical protein CCH79_00007806 [Gambusia affinis]
MIVFNEDGADVQQLIVVKEEAPDDHKPCVDPYDPKPNHIKEEQEGICISLWGGQFSGKEKIDAFKFPITAIAIKTEDDEHPPLLSQFYQDQIKYRVFPEENDEWESIKIEDHGDGSNSLEPEDTEKDEEDDDVVKYPVSELTHLSDSGLKTKTMGMRMVVVNNETNCNYNYGPEQPSPPRHPYLIILVCGLEPNQLSEMSFVPLSSPFFLSLFSPPFAHSATSSSHSQTLSQRPVSASVRAVALLLSGGAVVACSALALLQNKRITAEQFVEVSGASPAVLVKCSESGTDACFDTPVLRVKPPSSLSQERQDVPSCQRLTQWKTMCESKAPHTVRKCVKTWMFPRRNSESRKSWHLHSRCGSQEDQREIPPFPHCLLIHLTPPRLAP